MQKEKIHTNRLIQSTSPYLLQHAHNPVDWYEWGDEALEKAKQEDKPVLLSIGYSSCHWCHVMERECFENEDIAAIMNEYFVCIKLDREERPDIDQIYMEAVQAMGINGGWPLNVFLTPDQKPFYGGTYYPPKSWVQILTNIHKTYGTRRTEIEASAEELGDALNRSDLERFMNTSTHSSLQEDLDSILTKLVARFDKTWGGFDRAPKFVMPSVWQLLFRHYYLTGNKQMVEHALMTLKRIGMGGIYDQVGGGFSRYSVDEKWFAPHFEKMLYDNAQLMSLYSEAYAITKDEEFRSYVDETFSWLMREMTHLDGGFYSALDADSEGEEGKYYVWTKAEIEQLLGKDAALICDYYNVQAKGNWEHENNILMRTKSDSVFIKENDLSSDAWISLLRGTKEILLKEREKRIKPGLDDKIITAWNAMMITGLTDAYRYLLDEKFLKAAEKNMTFLENYLMEGKIIFRSFKNKRSRTQGFLDDYAFVIQAYINLYQVTFKEDYLIKAKSWLEQVIDQFQDKDTYFYYTGRSSQPLIARKKETFDNVIPSSNAIMSRNLLQLGILWDREDWQKMAEKMIEPLTQLIQSEPNYMSYWAIALTELKYRPAEIAIVGKNFQELRRQWEQYYLPFSLISGTKEKSNLPLMVGKTADQAGIVYVCYNKTCKLPAHTIEDALKQVQKPYQK